LHDPRPGAMMTKLPQKNGEKLTFANEAVHYKVKPGTMVIIPGYTPHQYPVDMGLEPFRFIHWNIQAVPSTISKATSMKKKDELSKK
jgi:oxalate decarboxylase/phosphoglucose isomerase-like protein (cupin superfamily)